MKFSALYFIAAILAGWAEARLPTEKSALAPYTYETALRERFDDPASVQFRNVTHGADGRSHCGEVNGLNRHGEYAGFQRFQVYGSNGAFMVLIADGEAKDLQCE